jgi:ABC-type bacteriocin/lantibiotic exporter with double-glycine peptidase domain
MEQQMIQESSNILDITHGIIAIVTVLITSGVGGVIYRFTKKDLREGLLTKEDVQEMLADIEEDVQELKTSNDQRKVNERDLYEKHRGIAERVGFIEGKLS